MKTSLISLAALLLLPGCSGPSQTRADFEANEARYAKIVWEVPPNDMRPLGIVQYRDNIPTIGFDGNNYRLVPTQWTVVYHPTGVIHSRERIEIDR